MPNARIAAGAAAWITLVFVASAAPGDVFTAGRGRRAESGTVTSGDDRARGRPIGRQAPSRDLPREVPALRPQDRIGGYDDPRFERGM